jgi:hypothetical protein
MRVLVRASIACLIFCVVVLASGCSGSDDSSDESGAAEESGETLVVFEGGTAEAGGWKVTVDSVEVYQDSEKEPDAASNVFLAADVTFENTTDEEAWWDTAAVLAMQDDAGNVYPADGMIVPNDVEVVMGSASPADPRGGLVAFEVPGDATGLVLVFTPEELAEGEEPAEWPVGDASAY